MKSPAFQFYPADFISDEAVELMDNRATGCYIRLLCRCWIEGSIPSDINKIAKLCREDSSTMAQLWTAISSRFTEAPDNPERLINPRLARERVKQEEYRQERVAAGSKGAKSRWDKSRVGSNGDTQRLSSVNGLAIAQPIANDGSLSSSSSSCIKSGEAEEGTIQQRLDRFRTWLKANGLDKLSGSLTGSKWERYLAVGFEVATLKLAVEEAVDHGAGEVPTYVYRTLDRWQSAKAYTPEAAHSLMSQHQGNKPSSNTRTNQSTRQPFVSSPSDPDLWKHIEESRPGGKS